MALLGNIMKRKDDMTDVPPLPKMARVDRPMSRQAEQAIADVHHKIDDISAERDQWMERAKKAEELCTKATAMIQARNDEIAELKGRMTGYQLERDEAVAKCAKAETKIDAAISVLLKPPRAPTPNVAPDAEAPNYAEPMPVPPTHQQMSALVRKLPHAVD